ncbi:hypothetical protein KBI52_04800, partial [Microvirga sp. HBU67558]|nr:hypothetical protein [Microvirga sp. HBU67558]
MGNFKPDFIGDHLVPLPLNQGQRARRCMASRSAMSSAEQRLLFSWVHSSRRTLSENCADKRAPQPAAPGRSARVEYEYQRQGTANLFLCFEPLAGWRHVEVTAHRTTKDFAEQVDPPSRWWTPLLSSCGSWKVFD